MDPEESIDGTGGRLGGANGKSASALILAATDMPAIPAGPSAAHEAARWGGGGGGEGESFMDTSVPGWTSPVEGRRRLDGGREDAGRSCVMGDAEVFKAGRAEAGLCVGSVTTGRVVEEAETSNSSAAHMKWPGSYALSVSMHPTRSTSRARVERGRIGPRSARRGLERGVESGEERGPMT